MKEIIIYTSWSMDPKYGTGVAVSLSKLLDGLKKRNIKFSLITNKLWSKSFFIFTIKRIIYNYLEAKRIIKLKPKILLGVDFDGFFINKVHTKYILNLRTNFSEIKEHETGIIYFICLIEEFLQKKAVAKADKIIVTSQYTKNKVIENYKIKANIIEVVSNGVDKNIFNNKKVYAEKENIILSVAALFPRKGVEYLIKALKILKTKGIKFKYIHIGDGLLNTNLNNLAKSLDLEKEVTFLGRISNRKKIANLYRKCKVFCHPCLQEDFGNVFLEAMASGKPIVTFNNSATREFIKNGKNGFIVPTKDIKKLANSIETLLKNEDLCYSMGKENINISKNYSWNKMTKKFIKILTKEAGSNNEK